MLGDLFPSEQPYFHVAFAEPMLETRKRTGLKVMIFLLVCAAVFYGVKRKIWAELH